MNSMQPTESLKVAHQKKKKKKKKEDPIYLHQQAPMITA